MNNSFTRLATISFVGRIAAKGLRYATFIVIGRSFGADGLGIFSYGLFLIGIGSIFSKVGLDNAVLKFIPQFRQNKKPQAVTGVILFALGGAFGIGVLVAVALLVALPHLDSFTTIEIGESIQLFVAGIPLYATFIVGRAATRGYKETKYDVLSNLVQSVALLLFLAVILDSIGTIRYLALAYIGSLAIGIGIVLVSLADLGAFRPTGWPQIPVRQITRFSATVALITVANQLMSWIDTFMMGIFEPASALGIYRSAYMTSVMLTLVLTAANSIFPSLASDLYNNDDIKRLGNVYMALSKWLFSLTCTGYIFLFFFGEDILGLFGAEFQSAWQMLVLLGLGQVVAAVTGPVGSLLMMTDGERLEMTNVWIAVAVNVVVNYVLILRYGAVGVAAGTAIAIGLLNILRLVQVYRYLRIHPFSVGYLKHTVAIGAAVLMMFLGTRVPFPNDTVSFLVTGVAALTTFGISIRLLGFDESDRYLLESVN